jgi:hypothetical protein
LQQARLRVGAKPLKALFDLLRGPALAARKASTRWRGLLVCAIDGTALAVPDSAGNTARLGKHRGSNGAAGYPQLRLLVPLAYQILRIAIVDATDTVPAADPDRASFAIALETAREQIVNAANVIAGTAIDLLGAIGRHVLDNLMPARRLWTVPAGAHGQLWLALGHAGQDMLQGCPHNRDPTAQRCVIHKILVRVSRRPELDLQGMTLAAAQQMIAV